MSSEHSSYRRILWATSVVGGATLASLIIGLARNKAVALIGGPSAVGLLGLFTSLVAMGASVTTLGLDTGSVRQLSHSIDDPNEVARVRRAIWTLAWPLALIGCAVMWIFREPLAAYAAGDARYATGVGILGMGVLATVISSAQLAVLQGHGRVGDLARVRLWGSLLATVIGIAAIYRDQTWGIVIAVVVTPVVNAMLAFWLGRRLPSSNWRATFAERLSDQWYALASIGAVVMLTNMSFSLSQLGTRSIVTNQLGLDSAGLYHACWSVTWVNLSLVLNAMAADYFPRVSKVANEPDALSATLNQQVHVALLLAGPALVLVSTAAPLVLTVLYSHAFADSSLLLRLLIAAGTLRLPIWALGYLLLARRAGPAYFLGELAATSIIPLTWLFLPWMGLNGAGFAAVVSAAISFAFYFIAVKRHGVELNRANLRMIGALFVFLLVLAGLFEVNLALAVAVGALGAVVLGWASFRQLRSALAV